MNIKRSFNVALFVLLCTIRVFAEDAAPSTSFNLHEWKLQIPGPKEVKDLTGYYSDYFHLNGEKEMCFHLDAAEKGTTKDAHYVRSELRHLPNWGTGDTHEMSAEVRAVSHLKPDKVTVLQIHGIMSDGKDAPPLLRVAVNNGDLVAVIRTGDAEKPENFILEKGLGSGWASVDISVKDKQLTIRVNGKEKVSHSLADWKFMNYFKAGCYPQATSGTAEVMFRKLTAR